MTPANSTPPPAQTVALPFLHGHLHEGGTGVTNFSPDEAYLYREAIRRHGDFRLAVLEADFMDHTYKGHWSLHQLGGDKWTVLPAFWPVFDAARKEAEAIALNPFRLTLENAALVADREALALALESACERLEQCRLKHTVVAEYLPVLNPIKDRIGKDRMRELRRSALASAAR